MRINKIDPRYIMIEMSELTDAAVNYDLPKEIRYKYINIQFQIFSYRPYPSIYKKDTITEFAVKRENIEKENIDIYVELNTYQNALIYAITHDCDVEILKILQKLVKSRERLTFKTIEELYGENVSNYIIRNGDYNYLEDKNENEKKDDSFILYDNDEIIHIDLTDKKNPPVLQNPDVK